MKADDISDWPDDLQFLCFDICTYLETFIEDQTLCNDLSQQFTYFIHMAAHKYVNGVKDHGGSLRDTHRNCIYESQLENIDQFFYLVEASRQRDKLIAEINQLKKGQP